MRLSAGLRSVLAATCLALAACSSHDNMATGVSLLDPEGMERPLEAAFDEVSLASDDDWVWVWIAETNEWILVPATGGAITTDRGIAPNPA